MPRQVERKNYKQLRAGEEKLDAHKALHSAKPTYLSKSPLSLGHAQHDNWSRENVLIYLSCHLAVRSNDN